MYKTLKETAEFLGKSEKTISRYIKRGLLNPEHRKSALGTLEYRFLTEDLERFKETEQQTSQKTEQKTDKKGSVGADLTQFLLEQTRQKDRQIERKDKEIERLTALLGMAQSKILQIEAPKKPKRSFEVLMSVFLVALALFFFFNLYPILKTIF